MEKVRANDFETIGNRTNTTRHNQEIIQVFSVLPWYVHLNGFSIVSL